MSSKAKSPSHQEVLEGFNKLRQEQRQIAVKLAELEADSSEHSIVIDALSKVEKDRKCYRLVGGVLVERTVAEVVPALEKHKGQIAQIIETLDKQLQSKGKELNEFKEKNNIRIQGHPGTEDTPKEKSLAKTSGVLVPNNS